MTTFVFDALSNGATITFTNPGIDILQFSSASAFAVTVGESDATHTSFTFGGKTVTVSGLGLRQIASSNVLFSDTSVLRVGDGLVGTAADDSGNNVSGTAGNDQFLGLAGDDDLHPGAGNDLVDGGSGSDRAWYNDATSGVTVDLSLTGPQSIGGGRGVDTLISIEEITGSAFDDIFFGNGENNQFQGGGGMDTVSYANAPGGISGNTVGTVTGTGIGTDSLDGTEALIGSSFNDILNGGANADTLEGGPGDDQIDGKGGIDTASYTHAPAGVTVSLALSGVPQDTAGAGLDTLIAMEILLGSAFDDALSGSANNDTLRGVGGADTLQGGAGNDVLEGGVGNDNLDGGTGVDAASYATAAAGVRINLGLATAQNTLGAGLDTLANIENLTGSDFNDTLTGSTAANLILGGPGNDIMNGGGGVDTASYAGATAGVTVNLALTTSQDTVGAGTDTLAGFENLTGTGFNDTLTGNAVANTITGGVGNDVMDGGAGVDTVSYAGTAARVTVSLALTGAQNTLAAGNDTLAHFENLTGSNFDDTLTGDAQNNVLLGGLGDDALDGGAGAADIASYAGAAGAVQANLLNNTATGGAGSDTLVGIESLLGSSFADHLTGNAGNNTLNGAAGADTMEGGAGNDFYVVDNAADFLSEAAGQGTDTVNASVSFGITVFANLENLTLTGTANNSAAGNEGHNVLTGNSGDNILHGGGGNDTLDGGAGADTMIGGTGNDTYVRDGLGLDVVTEGLNEGVDTVQSISGYTLEANIENLTLIGAAHVIGTGNELNNTIEGNAGNNTLSGGAGTDTASYANAAAGVTVNLAFATEQNTVGAGGDTLSGFENLTGSRFNDTLTGDALNNVLLGGAGNDALNGGAGVDSASYATATAGVNVTLAAAGAPQNTVGAGSDTLTGIESLIGSNLNDTLTGDALGNVLNGGNGNDVLNGGGGNDVLAGGAGTDNLSGGAGADFFHFSSKVGVDSVNDFASGTDKLRFSQAAIPVGDGDTSVEGAVVRNAPNGFAPTAELVIFTADILDIVAGGNAAATAPYAIHDSAIFVANNGTQSGLFHFVSSGADATVSASELTLLATVNTASTVLTDYMFVA